MIYLGIERSLRSLESFLFFQKIWFQSPGPKLGGWQSPIIPGNEIPFLTFMGPAYGVTHTHTCIQEQARAHTHTHMKINRKHNSNTSACSIFYSSLSAQAGKTSVISLIQRNPSLSCSLPLNGHQVSSLCRFPCYTRGDILTYILEVLPFNLL